MATFYGGDVKAFRGSGMECVEKFCILCKGRKEFGFGSDNEKNEAGEQKSSDGMKGWWTRTFWGGELFV